jgi:hypothetical protein
MEGEGGGGAEGMRIKSKRKKNHSVLAITK